MKSVRTWKKIV